GRLFLMYTNYRLLLAYDSLDNKKYGQISVKSALILPVFPGAFPDQRHLFVGDISLVPQRKHASKTVLKIQLIMFCRAQFPLLQVHSLLGVESWSVCLLFDRRYDIHNDCPLRFLLLYPMYRSVSEILRVLVSLSLQRPVSILSNLLF